jgi:hypothetical protein
MIGNGGDRGVAPVAIRDSLPAHGSMSHAAPEWLPKRTS